MSRSSCSRQEGCWEAGGFKEEKEADVGGGGGGGWGGEEAGGWTSRSLRALVSPEARVLSPPTLSALIDRLGAAAAPAPWFARPAEGVGRLESGACTSSYGGFLRPPNSC